MYVFKTYVLVDSSLKFKDLGLFIGNSNMPSEIYLNGHNIGRVGSFKERYTSQIHTSAKLFLPSELLNYGTDTINEICLQYYPKLAETRTLDKIWISDYETVSSYTFWRNFFGINLVQASMVFGLILFVYFLFGYTIKHDKSDLKYLYFAFFSLSFALSYVNLSFLHDTIPQLNLLRISRFGLTVSNLLLVYLTMSFVKLLEHRKILKIILLVPSILFVFLILLQDNVVALEEMFTQFVTFVNMPFMLFAFVLAIIGLVRNPNKNNIFYIIGFLMFLASIIHDSVLFSLKQTPYSWLIPHGYSIFITSIFFILASEQATVFKLSVLRAFELQKMKDNLEDLVNVRTAKIEQQKNELQEKSKHLMELNVRLSEKSEEINQQNEELQTITDSLRDINKLLSEQKNNVERKNEQIFSSINYASKIQKAILPSSELINQIMPESFILYRQKEIIGGDFYFAKVIGKKIVLAVADCTGHGVPGAMMSMFGIALIEDVLDKVETLKSNLILDKLRERLKKAFAENDGSHSQKDGMDIALCVYDTEIQNMSFAGANNALYRVRFDAENKPEFTEFKADTMPIGVYRREKPFTENEIDVQIGDFYYLFSDGYYSQLGETTTNPLKSKKFKELIIENSAFAPEIQKQNLDEFLEIWQGKNDQTDDILVAGFKII